MIRIRKGKFEIRDLHVNIREEIIRNLKKDISTKLGRGEEVYIIKDGANFVGYANWNQIFYNKPLSKKVIHLGPNMFLEARDYYRDNPKFRNDFLIVLDDGGAPVAQLYWEPNALRFNTGIFRDELWHYDCEKFPVNDDLLNRASAYVFPCLEEYTHAIANYIKKKYPRRNIYFLDEMAKFNIWNENGIGQPVKIAERWYELPSNQSYLYVITSNERHDKSWVPEHINLVYNSQNVLHSMTWSNGCMTHPGNLHPDKTILLLDNHCSGSGLGDISQIITSYAWLAEKYGYIPVADLSSNESTHFYEDGKNIWEEFFYPLNDMTVKEAKKCQNVIRASLSNRCNGWNIESHAFNPLYRESSIINKTDGYYKQKTRLNKKTWDFLLSHSNKVMLPRLRYQAAVESGNTNVNLNKQTRILGVMMRGTDYRQEFFAPKKTPNAKLETMISWCHVMMATGRYNYFFLSTEDDEYFEAFSKEFGSEMIYTDRPRAHDVVNNGKTKVQPIMNEAASGAGLSRLDMLRLYLLDVKCLSLCDDLISSVYCGSTRFATEWNENNYEYNVVIRDEWEVPPYRDLNVMFGDNDCILYGVKDIEGIKYLIERNPRRFIICDFDDEKRNSVSFDGVRVISPNELSNYIGVKAYITDRSKSAEIFNDLIMRGWKESDIEREFIHEIRRRFGGWE